MATVRATLWRQFAWLLLFLGVTVAAPLYMSTDSFLTWLYEKAQRNGWDNAASITYGCAEYYHWTGRDQRAAEVYELFISRWPRHDRVPDAIYAAAVAIRATAEEIDRTEAGSPEKVAKIKAIREKARLWFDCMSATYPAHALAERARRAAKVIRDGY